MFKIRYNLTGKQEEELRAVRRGWPEGVIPGAFVDFWERMAAEYRIEPATVVIFESPGGTIFFDAEPLQSSFTYHGFRLNAIDLSALEFVADDKETMFPAAGNEAVRGFWNRMGDQMKFIAVSVSATCEGLPHFRAARLIEAPKAEPAPEAKAPLAEYCLSAEDFATAKEVDPRMDHCLPPGGDQWTRGFWQRMAGTMGFHYGTIDPHPRRLPWFYAETEKGREAPTFDPRKPVKTRGGCTVRELHVFENGTMAGLRGGCRIPTVWAADGSFSQHTPGSDYDLVNEVTTRRTWVNIYPSDVDAFCYDSQEAADKAADGVRLGGKAFLIEWQE